MRAKILVLLFLMIGSPAIAADLEQIQRTIDCTPICGSKYCCVAAQAEIPACVIGGKKLSSIVKDMMNVSANEVDAFTKECAAPANELAAAKIARNAALSCKWGCCSNLAVARVFSDEKLFADVLSKTPPEQVKLVSGQRTKFVAAMTSNQREAQEAVLRETQKMMADSFLWIFCCTF